MPMVSQASTSEHAHARVCSALLKDHARKHRVCLRSIRLCPVQLRTKSGKRRVLKVSPWLEFESPGDASHAQRCIQQASCWGGQPSPRNLLVLLNPASGRGRWVSVTYGPLPPMRRYGSTLLKSPPH